MKARSLCSFCAGSTYWPYLPLFTELLDKGPLRKLEECAVAQQKVYRAPRCCLEKA